MRVALFLCLYLMAVPFLYIAMAPLWLGYQFCSLMARLTLGRPK